MSEDPEVMNQGGVHDPQNETEGGEEYDFDEPEDEANLTPYKIHNRTVLMLTFIFFLIPLALEVLALIFSKPLIMKNWTDPNYPATSAGYTLKLKYSEVCYFQTVTNSTYTDLNLNHGCVSYSNIDCQFMTHQYAAGFHDSSFCDRMQSAFVSLIVGVCLAGLAAFIALYGFFLRTTNDQALTFYISLFLAMGSATCAVVSQICLQHTRNIFTGDQHHHNSGAMWRISFSLVLAGLLVHIICSVVLIHYAIQGYYKRAQVRRA